MIVMNLDKHANIIDTNVDGEAYEIIGEAATASVIILDIVSKVLHDDDLARDLLTLTIHNKNALKDFRGETNIDFKEETTDA